TNWLSSTTTAVVSKSRYLIHFHLISRGNRSCCVSHSFPTRRSSDLLSQSRRSSGNVVPGVIAQPITAATTGATTTSPRTSHQSIDRKSTRLNSSHVKSSYAVFCLTKKTKTIHLILFHEISRVNCSCY